MKIIEVQHLSKSYGTIQALRDISFTIEKGSITGFLGPNGAGKTTTIGIMMQFIRQDSGEVKIFNQDVTQGVEIKRRIGLIPDANLPNLKVDTLLKHTGIQFGMSGSVLANRINEVIKLVGAASFRHRKTKTLSKGQKQRVKIANALLNDPELIIADEPTAGLDPVSRQTLLQLFRMLSREENKTIFFSNHIISEVEKVSDHIIMLNHGKIVAQGALDHIIASMPITNSYTIEGQNLSVKQLESIEGISYVEEIRTNRYQIQTKEELVSQTPGFLRELVNSDEYIITEFKKTSLELEDVFKEVIGNAN